MGKLALLLLLSIPVLAQDRAWKLSVVTVATSAVVDTQSSWDRYELNPALGRGTFGVRQAGVEVGVTAGMVLIERLILRRHPKYTRTMVWTNYVVASAHTGAAISNYRLSGR